jgi:ribosomal protein L31
MKNTFLILSFFLICTFASEGQKRKRTSPKKTLLTENQALECKALNKYTNAQLWQIEPFKSAKKIEVISFPFNVIMKFDSTIMKEVIADEIVDLPLKNETLDMRFIKEKIILDSSSTLSLMNTLFNVGFRGKPTMLESMKCYSPRHAVLFYDDKNSTKPYVYYEICFECHHFYVLEKKKQMSDKYKLGDFCNEKYKLLEDVFRKIGIKEGFAPYWK